MIFKVSYKDEEASVDLTNQMTIHHFMIKGAKLLKEKIAGQQCGSLLVEIDVIMMLTFTEVSNYVENNNIVN